MAEARFQGQEKRDPEKRRIPCRYFVRGFCREGKNCSYSHDRCDIPVCRYFQEGLCYYGENCWFRHPQTIPNISYLADYLVPVENFFSFDGELPPLSNINLLMAAAIHSPEPEVNNNTSENETSKEPISMEKAMEIWKNITEGDDDESACDSNKLLDNLNESLSVTDELNLYYTKLSAYDLKQWSVQDAIDLLCVIVDFDDSEYLNHDYYAGNALFKLFHLWNPSSLTAVDFLCALCDAKDVDMMNLLICLVSYPLRLNDFDCFLGEMLYHLYNRKPEVWKNEWVAAFLASVESDLECCSDVDAVDVLSSFGRLLKDTGKLGKLAHCYLLATGLQNSFECRCKTAECTCPVEVDEGVAFILFDGLIRRLDLSKSEKRTFFCNAVDELFLPSVLSQLGDSMGIKNAAVICKCREDSQMNENGKFSNMKCPGVDCSNMTKRDCVNNLCGRCCKRSGLWCDVHVDLFPTLYQTVRAHDLVKPRVHLARKEDLDSFLETKEDAQSVYFGPDFPVYDENVTKVIDLCRNLVVLELGSSDTGCGSGISNALLYYVVENCPKLRKLRLESAVNVSDDGMLKILERCNELEFLEVSGNDKISGRVSDRSLKKLFDRDVLPKLKDLCITDQHDISYAVVMRLRRCRSNVKITAGSTDSDSMAWSFILGMTGRSYGDGLF